MKIKFKKINPYAKIPTFGHGDSSNAGFDMYACLADENDDGFVRINPGAYKKISLGVAWEPVMTGMKGKKLVLIIKGRSGLAQNGIEVSNAGVIDEGYRGEINVIVRNHSGLPTIFQHGDRIAQGVVIALPEVEIEEVCELSDSTRGERGFGSSGK